MLQIVFLLKKNFEERNGIISLEEFLMLTYFDNDFNSYLNIDELSKHLGLSTEVAYQTFNNLMKKKLLI